jgi:hypothetical protein
VLRQEPSNQPAVGGGGEIRQLDTHDNLALAFISGL